tara:strand:+ start:545 stop:805 length:261 start_codon:yes stop_codon:yes gene_type:complete
VLRSTVVKQCRSDLLKVGQVAAKDKWSCPDAVEKTGFSRFADALAGKCGLCRILFRPTPFCHGDYGQSVAQARPRKVAKKINGQQG